MLAHPDFWSGYYTGTHDEQRLARRYSYSDRMRYYWPDPRIHEAVEALVDRLATAPIPLPLLSQYLPQQYARVRAGVLDPSPRELVIDHIRDTLRPYAAACRPAPSTQNGRTS